MDIAQGFGGGCLEHPPKSFPEPPERLFYSGTLMATACSYWTIFVRIPVLIWSPQAGIPQGTCSSNLREGQKNRSRFMIDYLQSWPQRVLPSMCACSFATWLCLSFYQEVESIFLTPESANLRCALTKRTQRKKHHVTSRPQLLEVLQLLLSPSWNTSTIR